jgi:hypothetical protein
MTFRIIHTGAEPLISEEADWTDPTFAKPPRKAVQGRQITKVRQPRPDRDIPAVLNGYGKRPLIELALDACRWPVTDDAPYLFCGRKKKGPGSYCDRHGGK